MRKIHSLFLCIIICQSVVFGQNKALTLSNEAYKIELNTGKKIQLKIQKNGTTRVLSPEVKVVLSRQNPQLVYANSTSALSPQAGWKMNGTTAENDFFKVGNWTTLTANRVLASGSDFVQLGFAEQPDFVITLEIRLPKGTSEPVFETQLKAKQTAWFSAGFSGLMPQDTAQVQFLYQPMVWSWRRFPEKSYLTTEQHCTTAAVFVNSKGLNEGITPDPTEIPYRFALLPNSRFGLLLRNANGQAQPMCFAPLLGTQESYLETGKTATFKSRYFLQNGDWYAGLTHVLKDIFRYRNERQNAAVTLNQTLDNMLNFAMNDKYGGWIDSLKAFDYLQDAVGTVKIVSAMHQLGAALVTGNDEIYRRRALPTIEYAMSREKYLYTTDPRQTTQSPSRKMLGPCVEVGELSGLYQMTNGQTQAFESELNRIFGKSRKLNLNTETGGGSWQDYLARYRINKNPDDLQKAKSGADMYLTAWEKYPNNFKNDPGLLDREASFLTDYTPRLYDLFELYELTQEKRYLNMAHTAARQMLFWLRSNPMAPDSIITVNRGGKVKGIVGKRYKISSYDFLPNFYDTTHVAEQRVEAWRTSLVGLPPEQARTYNYGPIMLTHHPAWFLRLAHLTGDVLLRDAAYNAILGRYASFPGYYFTDLHTNVYQSADYPMHNYWNMRYNAMFYNHVFPHITLLIDFLVSDAFYRSNGQIDFPSVYAPGYAFLTSKVYGHQPGSVYGDKNVKLWLPPAAVQSAAVGLNHLLGVGENDFYVVLMNTENQNINEKIRLNPELIGWVKGQNYRVKVLSKEGAASAFVNGQTTVQVPAGGLVALKIEGLKVEVPLFSQLAKPLTSTPSQGFVRDETSDNGTLTAMLINTFPQFSDAYIYTTQTDKELKSVQLTYRIDGGKWQTKTDLYYPFEFSIHLNNPQSKLEFTVKSTDLQGIEKESKAHILTNKTN